MPAPDATRFRDPSALTSCEDQDLESRQDLYDLTNKAPRVLGDPERRLTAAKVHVESPCSAEPRKRLGAGDFCRNGLRALPPGIGREGYGVAIRETRSAENEIEAGAAV